MLYYAIEGFPPMMHEWNECERDSLGKQYEPHANQQVFFSQLP